MISPIDMRGVLNAIPKFTGMTDSAGQRLPDIHSLYDSVTSGRARTEGNRDGTDGRGPDARIETPSSRLRAQSEVRRSPENTEGTPSKCIRSSSIA